MIDQLADGRQINLLGYPFDQYQRYQDIRVAVDIIRQHKRQPILKILDVGGTLLSKRFLAGDDILAVNLKPTHDTQVCGDGSRLPLETGRFDVAIAVDTLEHVPPKRRQAFVAELLRVSRAFVIITGPFSSSYNEAAEEILYDFLTTQLGMQHPFLREHLENGLPDLHTIAQMLHPAAETIAIPSGYVQHWLPLMLIKHILMSIPGGSDISDELDRFYNYTNYWSDHQIPSYRHLMVAAKPGHTDTLGPIRSAFEQVSLSGAPNLNGVLAMWQALRWPTILRQQADTVQQLQSEIARLHAENRQLAALVSGYESGRFIRFMAALKQLGRATRRA